MTICFVHGFCGSPWCSGRQLERSKGRGDYTKSRSNWRHTHSYLWPLEWDESKTGTTDQNTFVWFLHMAWRPYREWSPWCQKSQTLCMVAPGVNFMCTCAHMRAHEHEHNTRTHAHTHEEAFYKSASEVTLLTSILLCGRTIHLPITKGEITDQDIPIFILQDFINSRYHKHMEKKIAKIPRVCLWVLFFFWIVKRDIYTLIALGRLLVQNCLFFNYELHIYMHIYI